MNKEQIEFRNKFCVIPTLKTGVWYWENRPTIEEIENFWLEKLEQQKKEWKEKIEKEYELKYIPSKKEKMPERDWFESA